METTSALSNLVGTIWKNNATAAIIEITKDGGDGRLQYRYSNSIGGFYISKELLYQYFSQELQKATA